MKGFMYALLLVSLGFALMCKSPFLIGWMGALICQNLINDITTHIMECAS
jgi:hypothetical protein